MPNGIEVVEGVRPGLERTETVTLTKRKRQVFDGKIAQAAGGIRLTLKSEVLAEVFSRENDPCTDWTYRTDALGNSVRFFRNIGDVDRTLQSISEHGSTMLETQSMLSSIMLTDGRLNMSLLRHEFIGAGLSIVIPQPTSTEVMKRWMKTAAELAKKVYQQQSAPMAYRISVTTEELAV